MRKLVNSAIALSVKLALDLQQHAFLVTLMELFQSFLLQIKHALKWGIVQINILLMIHLDIQDA